MSAGVGGLLLVGMALSTGAAAAPPGAVPVLCDGAVAAGSNQVLSCRRQDTGAGFTAVPTGTFLHVTDVLITRDTLATTGEFYATLGRESGATLPDAPSFNASGTPLEPTRLHFTTPVIVLEAGDELGVRNDASSDFSIDLFVSGYLASDGTL